MADAATTLCRIATDALEERKAVDLRVLDVRALTDFTDFMIVASGRSTRQVAALAENVVEQAKAKGYRPMGVEGLREGEWVLVDLCDVVVHVMLPEVRDFYQLEKLWGREDARSVDEHAAPA